jgi:hypothetical protein
MVAQAISVRYSWRKVAAPAPEDEKQLASAKKQVEMEDRVGVEAHATQLQIPVIQRPGSN